MFIFHIIYLTYQSTYPSRLRLIGIFVASNLESFSFEKIQQYLYVLAFGDWFGNIRISIDGLDCESQLF